jgi:hypothetical protein
MRPLPSGFRDEDDDAVPILASHPRAIWERSVQCSEARKQQQQQKEQQQQREREPCSIRSQVLAEAEPMRQVQAADGEALFLSGEPEGLVTLL